MINWVEPEEVVVPDYLIESFGGHPLLTRALVRRGLEDLSQARSFLDPAHYRPTSPNELPGLELAANRLERAISDGEVILVWGDFDVDGQTATTLFVSALRELGANVFYHIPVRAVESHGVNLPILKENLEKSNNAVRVLLTCDTGIAANEAIDYAQSKRVDVIVTDHHELPDRLPNAYSIVNPRMLSENHPLGGLPGVGVAYMLAEELFTRRGNQPACKAFLDLVALGIVADVAPLAKENRYLLQLGLEELRSPRRTGLKVLMEGAELDPKWLTEEHIGFVLAPRLNAIGRLADANPIVELLTTGDRGRAKIITQQLEGLNSRRQMLTSQIYQGALALIKKEPSVLEAPILVLSHPTWEAGVIGIVASRLVERFKKPVILIAAPEDDIGRGSARSVNGVDITMAIASQKGLLIGYGGHSMAAGFSIAKDHISEFTRGIIRNLEGAYEIPRSHLILDDYLPLSELTLDLVMDLERMAPFGAGNPPLILTSRDVKITRQKPVGRNQEHLLLTLEELTGAERKVIWWQGADEARLSGLPEGLFDLAYVARSSTFSGQREVQVEWVDFRVSQGDGRLDLTEKVSIIDHRMEMRPYQVINQILEEDDVLVWAEAWSQEELKKKTHEGKHPFIRGRDELQPAETLVVWTIPPGGETLREALEIVKPSRILLFANNPELDTIKTFTQRIAGLVKYSLKHHETTIKLNRLASAMAHGIVSILAGLEWLQARGLISIININEEFVVLEKGEGQIHGQMKELNTWMELLLEEARAYREYYLRVEKDSLLD